MARVLVTRALPEAEETAQGLRALGFEALVVPLRELVPVVAHWPNETFDALIATSRHAFTAPLPWTARVTHLPVYVVGERTGEAARAAGFSDIRVGGGDATALAERISAEGKAGAQFLYLAGEPRRPELESALLAAGFLVTPLLCYRMVAARSLPGAIIEEFTAGRIDAVLHFSGETAKTFCDLAHAAGLLRQVSHVRHFCLSPSIAAKLRNAFSDTPNLGLIVAEEPNAGSLLAKLGAEFT
jgi:uroporphyrinogen-III synthase